MRASLVLVVAGCLFASTLAMPHFQPVPAPMKAFGNPMGMMPMGPMPMGPPPPPLRGPQPFNRFPPQNMAPMMPGNLPALNQQQRAELPKDSEAVVKATEMMRKETAAEDARLPMRAKFEQWLEVLEDLKQKQATDEQYAEAFKDFVDVEPRYNMYLSEREHESTRTLTNKVEASAGETAATTATAAASNSSTVTTTSTTDNEYKPPTTIEEARAALKAYLNPAQEDKETSVDVAEPATVSTKPLAPAAVELKAPAATIAAAAEPTQEAADDQEDEDDEDYDEDEDEVDEQMLNDEEEFVKFHNQLFVEAHKPAPLRPAMETAPLGQQSQTVRKPEAMGPPQLWMSARSHNTKKNGKSETIQEFEMKRVDAAEAEEEENIESLKVDAEPSGVRNMQFESQRRTAVLPRLINEEEWTDEDRSSSSSVAPARRPHMLAARMPQPQPNLYRVKAIQPLTPIGFPLALEDQKVSKLSMKTPNHHHQHHYNHHHPRHDSMNNYYLAHKIH